MRKVSRMVMVVCIVIWPFANSGKARDGDDESPSGATLNARIGALEHKIQKLEDKINQLEERHGTTGIDSIGARPRPTDRSGGSGPCPGEWRRIGGGWTCSDPNAK
jgi:hypothetical protein